MAGNLQRYCYDNEFTASATIITVSSEQTSFTAESLRDPFPTKQLRSKVGWNIGAWNNKLDITEGVSGAATATITSGNYATGAAKATEVQTQLNAAATDNTWSCGYSSNKFTISHDDVETGELLCGSGSNVLTSVMADLGYNVEAFTGVDLDGSNDYYHLGSDLTGNADSKSFILFGVIRIDGGDGTVRKILTNLSAIDIGLGTDNKFHVIMKNSSLTTILDIETSNAYVSSSKIIRFLISADLATTTAHLYIDNVSDKVETTVTDDTIDFTQAHWDIGSTAAHGNKMNGAVGVLYFAPGQYLGFSQVANRNKFYASNDLGANGSTPTGTVPLIYCTGGAGSFGTNLGSGGSFTETGSPSSVSLIPDRLAGASYLAENDAYKSREWVKFDLTAASGLTAIALFNTNGGASDTYTIEANATDAWTSPSYSQALSGTGALRIYNMSVESYRWWRVLIEDQENTDGYSAIGIASGDSYFEPAHGLLEGYSNTPKNLSEIVTNDSGGIIQLTKGTRQLFVGSYAALSSSDESSFATLQAAVGVGGSMVFELDPANDLTGKTYWMVLAEALDFKNRQLSGPTQTVDMGIRLVEQIG